MSKDKNISKAPGKKVCILGLGKTGAQSALFLKQKGFQVFVSEGGRSLEILSAAEKLMDQGIEVETGAHDLKKIAKVDWVLCSPGISPGKPIFKAVESKNLPMVSEIEVASWFSPTENVIAVTGTAGKTTVTTLLTQLFKRAKGRAIHCGNVGNPWIGELANTKPEDFVIVEVSSFQLALCHSFRPKVGILLNVSPNHLDWHPDMMDYVRSKLRLFQWQTSGDYAVIRQQDREAFFKDFSFQAKVIHFDQVKENNPNEEVVRRVAEIFSIDSKHVEATFENFEGIEHRLDRLTVVGGVTYVNDSKCTTPASLEWALKQFPDKRVILIAGGKPKTADFDYLSPLVKQKVKRAVLIGQGQSLLMEAWKDDCVIEEAVHFRQAVELAHRSAKEGDVVLLSPACASFDMFKNYEERGKMFAKIVQEVTTEMWTEDYVERG